MTREEGREFLKPFRFDQLSDEEMSDQMKKLPQPPLEKAVKAGAKIIDLVSPEEVKLNEKDIRELFYDRKSVRVFNEEAMTKDELSFLLWASQGVKSVMDNRYAAFRTVPSAGARHPFETYLFVNNVADLERGIYRYMALEHKLELIKEGDFRGNLAPASLGQKFAEKSAIVFAYSVIPYRTEWRYFVGSYKPILLDAGHVGQNLYLACEALNLGTVALASYSVDEYDEMIGLDGEDEFIVYVFPVGKYGE
jgi:SagB-type dehydrogenase family enzyme